MKESIIVLTIEGGIPYIGSRPQTNFFYQNMFSMLILG